MTIPFKSETLGKLILRLTLGLLILFHGVSKALHPVGAITYIGGQLAAAHLPTYLVYGVFIGELLAPLMIILGVYARIGGLFVVINMIFAVTLVHTGQLLSLSKTGGWALELQGFYLLTGLALFFLGSGKIALRPD